ncbi:MAG: hypothetical protein CBHOC_0230 [uncultured Caballeronia sp.]|nr:MAG: hypothetical protein CBHOC_0230 [uncultured Caballeronia sp.]
MNMGGEMERAEARYQEFLAMMSAQRYFLTIAEQKAARALLAQGFGFVEVAAFLESSPWIAFYRECLKAHRLPECPQTREALRESFELGELTAGGAGFGGRAMTRPIDRRGVCRAVRSGGGDDQGGCHRV